MSRIMCFDEEIGGNVNATGVPFDNTGTGLSSTNVQGAISELTKLKIAVITLTANSAGQFLIPVATYKNIVSADLIFTEGYFKTQTSYNADNFIIRYKNASNTFISGSHQVRVVYYD